MTSSTRQRWACIADRRRRVAEQLLFKSTFLSGHDRMIRLVPVLQRPDLRAIAAACLQGLTPENRSYGIAPTVLTGGTGRGLGE